VEFGAECSANRSDRRGPARRRLWAALAVRNPPRAGHCSRFPIRSGGDELRWWTSGSGCDWRRDTRDASLRRCHLFGANHLNAGGNRQVRPQHPTCLSSNDSRLHPVRSTRPFGDPRIGVGHRRAERRHHRRKRSLPATPHARRRVIPPTPARRRPRRGSSGEWWSVAGCNDASARPSTPDPSPAG
jgi:hypothetical protein